MLRWTRDEMKGQAQRAGGSAGASGSPLLPTHEQQPLIGLSLALRALTAGWGHTSRPSLSSLGYGTEGLMSTRLWGPYPSPSIPAVLLAFGLPHVQNEGGLPVQPPKSLPALGLPGGISPGPLRTHPAPDKHCPSTHPTDAHWAPPELRPSLRAPAASHFRPWPLVALLLHREAGRPLGARGTLFLDVPCCLPPRACPPNEARAPEADV